jgi:phage tail-like protein
MNANRLDAYVFDRPEHWARCLLRGFDTAAAGGLTQPAPPGTHARLVDSHGPARCIAAGHNGLLLWRTEPDGEPATLRQIDEDQRTRHALEIEDMLASSPRWLLERNALWAYREDPPALMYFECSTLEVTFAVDIEGLLTEAERATKVLPRILDITTDGRGGAWLLLGLPMTHTRLAHIDCKGRYVGSLDVPGSAARTAQVACLARGGTLALVDAAASALWIVPTGPSARSESREYSLRDVIHDWKNVRLTSDGMNTLVIGGMPKHGGARWSMHLFDAQGQWRDGPLTPFAQARAGKEREPCDTAVQDDVFWFALEDGVWRLDSTDACGARAAEGILLTPALQSPEPGSERGWLRAELAVDLPAGASLEADYISTDDADEARRIIRIANDWRQSVQARIESIERRTVASSIAPIRLSGPQRLLQPVSIPLFRTRDRWLWLRLRVTAPPGAARPHLGRLRVIYPDLSIERYLPRAFRGSDPSTDDFLRRLLGVIETTTQSIDARIASIGAHIDPRTAPDSWLDMLGGWLALPWDDALPASSKRRLLENAAVLLAQRGTRSGTRRLLESLLGKDAAIRIEDPTVDHPATGLGDARTKGPALPVLLAGVSPRIARTDRSARLNRTWLSVDRSADDPLRMLQPTLVLTLSASHDMRTEIEPLLAPVLAQYVPAAIRLRIRWRMAAGPRMTPVAPGTYVLDAEGPGVLDLDSMIGRTVLTTRAPGRLGRDGLVIGFRIE